jgi:3-phosphoshikimate 1-carboxyvinyltransferase
MSHFSCKQPAQSAKASPLSGSISVPGDKSISHRALMLSALAIGHSTIKGLLEGDDVLATASALRQLGVTIEQKDTIWHVNGVGIGGFTEPDNVLDMGNAGTGSRLLMGLVASAPFNSNFTGDSSLRSRPMGRVIDPLKKMGADFVSRSKGRFPLMVIGNPKLTGITYSLAVPSAQVKSAILLAALSASGQTTIIEPEATRDHTERMLQGMGFPLNIQQQTDGSRIITIQGQVHQPSAWHIEVPGDPSSAAFAIVAATLVPKSDITINKTCLNKTRIGLLTTLIEMGADITISNQTVAGGEEIGDIRVRYHPLHGVVVPAERAPSMIDEYPILAIAAAMAQGETRMEGLEELRVKESDRLSAIAAGLAANGIEHIMLENSLIIRGSNTPPHGGGRVLTHHDHRIAMSFLVLGMITTEPVMIDDMNMIATSFPNFIPLINQLGGAIESQCP